MKAGGMHATLTFSGLHTVVSLKIELFLTTIVRMSNAKYLGIYGRTSRWKWKDGLKCSYWNVEKCSNAIGEVISPVMTEYIYTESQKERMFSMKLCKLCGQMI
jgi:hypothetical protein